MRRISRNKFVPGKSKQGDGDGYGVKKGTGCGDGDGSRNDVGIAHAYDKSKDKSNHRLIFEMSFWKKKPSFFLIDLFMENFMFAQAHGKV